ncbi:MAG: type II toxin-antitoxin system VapC family toxin [Dehalococcoidia bacterium]|nr:type II toxin-antitoxin system VapC family toxin [Dehalococcoidia bacterium]
MIVPDLNLLVYAHNTGAPFHERAKEWWEDLINGQERVGVPWAVVTGFVRLMTHPRVLTSPVAPSVAMSYVSEWFSFPHVARLNPGSNHLSYFRQNLIDAGVGGNLVTDCHIAALAMEYQAELHSNDTDFSRFSGLRWRNPL